MCQDYTNIIVERLHLLLELVPGLDWNEVKPLIEKQLGDLDIPVCVYVTYQKGVKANES